MFFFFFHTYQGPEIRAVFNALGDDLLDEIAEKGSNLSWTKEKYNQALEELLPCLVNCANHKYPSEKMRMAIHNYSHTGAIDLIPLKLCIFFIFLKCLDFEDVYINFIKKDFDDIIGRLNKTSYHKASFDIDMLNVFVKSEEDFFKISCSEYNDIYNKYEELKTKCEDLERENQILSERMQDSEVELSGLRKHAYLSTLVDFLVENDAKREEKDVILNILGRMYTKDQNEDVKEVYDRLHRDILADKKKAQGGATFKYVAPGAMNVENIEHVDNLGHKS